jgi:ABC-type antimicrobial peptide transport system permease subunit
MDFSLTLENVLLGGIVGLVVGAILAVVTAFMTDISNAAVHDYKPERSFQYMLVGFGVLSGAFLTCIGWAWWTIPLVNLSALVGLMVLVALGYTVLGRIRKRS